MFSYLILSCNTEVDATFANECWDIGGGEEYEGEREVFDEGDVETGFAPELYVTAFEELEGWGLETAFCGVVSGVRKGREGIAGREDEWEGRSEQKVSNALFGTAKRSRPSRL